MSLSWFLHRKRLHIVLRFGINTAVYDDHHFFNTYATCTERVQAAQKVKDDIPFWTALKATRRRRRILQSRIRSCKILEPMISELNTMS